MSLGQPGTIFNNLGQPWAIHNALAKIQSHRVSELVIFDSKGNHLTIKQ